MHRPCLNFFLCIFPSLLVKITALTFVPPSTMSVPMGIDGNTRCTFPIDLPTATALGEEVNGLIRSFKTIKEMKAEGKGGREEVLTFSSEVENVQFEIECNPNIFPGEGIL